MARARWRAQQARENALWYEHREVGYNYRLSNLLAAVGCAQLDRLPEIVRRKRRIFDFYRALFSRMPNPPVPFPCGAFTSSTRWLSVFLFPTEEERDALAARLAEADIETRPVWKPMHLQPVFQGCRVYGGRYLGAFQNWAKTYREVAPVQAALEAQVEDLYERMAAVRPAVSRVTIEMAD